MIEIDRDRDRWTDWLRELIFAAEQVRDQAYAPYSNYKVGAAVIGSLGNNVYVGCNVENAAYTGSHAETGAIAQLVANGEKQIHSLACATKDGGAPCGDCRQRIWELSGGNKEVRIYLVDESGAVQETTIGELLPFAFSL
jgi:cytidine deaminase